MATDQWAAMTEFFKRTTTGTENPSSGHTSGLQRLPSDDVQGQLPDASHPYGRGSSTLTPPPAVAGSPKAGAGGEGTNDSFASVLTARSAGAASKAKHGLGSASQALAVERQSPGGNSAK